MVVHRFGEDFVGEVGEVATKPQSACRNSKRIWVFYHGEFVIFLEFRQMIWFFNFYSFGEYDRRVPVCSDINFRTV